MVERQDAEYTVTEQCELLGISRSGVYYVPTVSERKIEIMPLLGDRCRQPAGSTSVLRGERVQVYVLFGAAGMRV